MRRWFPFLLTAVFVALLAAAPARGRLDARPAQAADTFEVVTGTDVEAELIETNAFLPRVVTVAAGDTVSWRFGGFHTVSFLAGNPRPDLFVPGPGPGELTAGPAFFPIPLGPMPPGGPYDGRTLVSSGTPSDSAAETPPFTLTFTQPGIYPYVCLVHPGMAGEVVVQQAGTPLPETPAQVKDRGQAEFAEIQGAVKGAGQLPQSASVTTAGGATVHTVDVGVNAPVGASMLAFLPSDITVRRGDVIAFTNADTFNPHTVTFTSGEEPPAFGDAVPSDMGPPQIIFRADVAGPTGGTTYTGQGYVNSGILLPGQSFALTVDAPAGTYTYICLIHGSLSGGMKATITVTE